MGRLSAETLKRAGIPSILLVVIVAMALLFIPANIQDAPSVEDVYVVLIIVFVLIAIGLALSLIRYEYEVEAMPKPVGR